MDPKSLDKVIHERVRLAIMSALAARDRLSFNELKELLDLTDGNLSVNARVLEEHGLIKIEKDFVGRKPRTTYAITRLGRTEFQKYVETLEKMIHPNLDVKKIVTVDEMESIVNSELSSSNYDMVIL